MSPEQARGQAVDQRADIYASACIMYEMLTGNKPFDADSPVGIIMQRLHEQPTPFADNEFAKDLNAHIEWVCLKAMAVEPEQRYQTMTEFLDDLSCLKRSEPPLRAQKPEIQIAGDLESAPSEPGPRKNSTIAILALSICLLVVFGVAYVLSYAKKNPVQTAVMVQQLSPGFGGPPEDVLKERNSGPMVKSWVLKQEQPHTGLWTVYLSPTGMANVNDKMGCTLVTAAPDWNVVMYNDKTRVYFGSPMSEWNGASLKNASAKTASEKQQLYQAMLMEKRPKKLKEGVILGHRAGQYLTDNLASTGLKKVEFWVTDDIQAPAELKQVFSKIYGVGLSTMAGLPLRVSYIDENGKRTPVFDTTSAEISEVPSGMFGFPKSYKKVDSEISVLMDKKGQEAMAQINSENKDSPELDELLGKRTKQSK